jgi:hypothetical protein
MRGSRVSAQRRWEGTDETVRFLIDRHPRAVQQRNQIDDDLIRARALAIVSRNLAAAALGLF